jgi:anti-sigma factor RsiW
MLLHALLDDELDAANVAAVEAHLRTCPDCAAEFEQLKHLHQIMADPTLRQPAPAGLRDRIDAALPAAPRGRNPWPARLALTLGIPQQSATSGLEQQMVASHVRSLLADHLVDIPTSDRHVVKPWFNGKIDFSPPTPDLKAAGFPLVGGRLDYIGGRVVPAIVYRRNLHTINVFAWPAGKAPAGETMATDGYTLVHWRQGDLDFWAVSDVAGGDLDQFRAAFVAATH